MAITPIAPSDFEASDHQRLVIKPIQASLISEKDNIDPYCKFYLGQRQGKTEPCKNGGKYPHWKKTVGLKTKGEPICELKIKSKKFGHKGKTLGTCTIDLNEINTERSVMRWFDLYHKKEPAGKILLEISFEKTPNSPISNE